jgi:hypothetical protein
MGNIFWFEKCWTDLLLWKYNKIQNNCKVNEVVVWTLWTLWKWMMKSYMFLMMFWKRQVPLPKKIKTTLSERIGKINEGMKTSE